MVDPLTLHIGLGMRRKRCLEITLPDPREEPGSAIARAVGSLGLAMKCVVVEGVSDVGGK